MSEDNQIADMLDGVPATMRIVQYMIRTGNKQRATTLLRAAIERLAAAIDWLYVDVTPNPCPRCGGEATVLVQPLEDTGGHLYSVVCKDRTCGSGPIFADLTKFDAVSSWNRVNKETSK